MDTYYRTGPGRIGSENYFNGCEEEEDQIQASVEIEIERGVEWVRLAVRQAQIVINELTRNKNKKGKTKREFK